MTCRLWWCAEMETRCRIPIWRTFGRIQWHVILEPRITLQGAATWWIHCHNSRATCHIAGCKNSIRHIENRFSPYFIYFFVFNAVRLWWAAAFVSSPIHLFYHYCYHCRWWIKILIVLCPSPPAEIMATTLPRPTCKSQNHPWLQRWSKYTLRQKHWSKGVQKNKRIDGTLSVARRVLIHKYCSSAWRVCVIRYDTSRRNLWPRSRPLLPAALIENYDSGA